jgi:hypothetical protein
MKEIIEKIKKKKFELKFLLSYKRILLFSYNNNNKNKKREDEIQCKNAKIKLEVQ